MAIDWTKLLNVLSTGANAVNALTANPGIRTAAGLGLTGAGLLQREEPGYAMEATQYLRNRLAPQGVANQFTSNLGPLSAGFQPYLNQLRQRGIADVQQKYINVFPKTVGPQGPEIGGVSRYITEEALPREQALLSSLGLSSLDTGGQAARSLLRYAKPDPLGASLATLGLNLLPRQEEQTGLPTTALSGNAANATQLLSQLAGQPGGIGSALSRNPQLIAQLGAAGDALQPFLSGWGGMGRFAPIGQLSAADIIRQVQAGTMTAQEGLALFGRTGLIPALGAGAAGFGAGQLASRLGQNQAQSTLGGALGGAATGAAIGSVIPGLGTAIGAVVGGLGGLFGGFFGERRQQQDIKESFRRADLDSQADQVQEIGSFFTQRLGALGADTSAFQQTVARLIQESPGPGDEQGDLARLGGQTLLAALQRMNPNVTSLNQVPGLRQEFIEHLMGSTTTAQNSRYAGGPPINFISGEGGGVAQPWVTLAGLKHGGLLRRGSALVGEDGAELLTMTPIGALVTPL